MPCILTFFGAGKLLRSQAAECLLAAKAGSEPSFPKKFEDKFPQAGRFLVLSPQQLISDQKLVYFLGIIEANRPGSDGGSMK
jgi:hypothetical protein